MGIVLKVIASSVEPLQLSSNGQIGSKGLAGYANEDAGVVVVCMHLPNATPVSVNEVWRLGARIEKATINQVQDLDAGNIPAEYWFAAIPFGPMPGDTVARSSYCCTPQNTVCTFVSTAFTIPAPNATVQVIVLDTSGFAVGNYSDYATDEGVFVGGRFWDVVSIDSATQMTLRLRDAFGAPVTMLG